MISSQKEEEIVIKWLLAETITYQNQTHLWFKSDWLTHTGIHKTIFKIIEKFNIPVTRSWYLYGGYIHSDLLIGRKLNQYKYDYTKNPQRLYGLIRKAKRLHLPTDEIKTLLKECVDEIFSQTVDSYLRVFYDDAPKKLRSIYKAKHELGSWDGLLDRFKFMSVMKHKEILTNITNIYEMISEFHLSAFRLYDDELLQNLNLQFSYLLEESLRKLEILIREKKKISKAKLRTLAKGREIFDNYVWRPYACQISYDTINGIRTKSQKSTMKRRKLRTIKDSSSKFNEFSSELQRRGLKLSVDNIQRLHKLESVNDEFEKSLYTIINIYKRSKEEN